MSDTVHTFLYHVDLGIALQNKEKISSRLGFIKITRGRLINIKCGDGSANQIML
jgi:hypothetical protein